MRLRISRCGLENLRVCVTMQTFPAAFAASSIRCESFSESAIGISTWTCLPIESASVV